MERARLLNDRRRVQGDDSRSPLASAASWSRFENITGRLNCRLPNGLNEPGTAEIGGELAERTEKTADKSTEEAKNSGGDNSRGIGSNDSKVLRSKSKRERAISALKARFSAFYLFLCACGGWKLGSESGSFRFRRMNYGGESTSLESFDNTTDNDGSGSSKSFSNISSPSNDNKEKERAKVTLASSVLWHARQNDVSAVEKLLEQDPSLVTARDYDGRTALHAAALHGSLDVAKCLIAHGADINAQDRWQNSPLADAEGANQQRMMDLLKEYGGKSLGNHGSREAKTVAPPLPQKCDWEIDPSEIDFSTSQLVGKGSFGEILKASWRGTPVAVKRILPSLSDDRLIVQDFRHEVELLVKLRHPNIVQFLGAVTKTPPLMLITEFLRGGDLHQFLKEKGALPASTAVNFALDMARGMTYLHNGPNVIIHRDLKPRNILMVDSNHLKVGDFGLSKLINVKHAHDMYKLTGETGSYRYMAPEVFEHRRYDTKVDVFSFAMILYQMFEGAPPYPNLDPYEAAKLVAKGDRPLFRARSYPADLKELIENCWDAEIQNRPSFLAILSKLEKIKENLPHEHHHWNFLHHT